MILIYLGVKHTVMERKKVISGRDAARLTKIAGLIGENFKGAEPYTVDKFKADLESGEFAFPGGYPTYFITDDGDCLSYDSAKENAEQIIDAIQTRDNSGWRVVGRDINWEDPDLYCADSGKRIPSAYAEPEEGIENDDEHDPSDDFVDSDPWTHGPDNDLYGEGKTIKLSSLSEGLRKEVKKHLKEGKAKLGQMPDSLKRMVMKENEEMSKMMNNEAEHSLKNASHLHAQALSKIQAMPDDAGFGGGPKEYKLGILRAMDPKRMSQSDIETCNDLIAGY